MNFPHPFRHEVCEGMQEALGSLQFVLLSSIGQIYALQFVLLYTIGQIYALQFVFLYTIGQT